jgi:hypothetical protein
MTNQFCMAVQTILYIIFKKIDMCKPLLSRLNHISLSQSIQRSILKYILEHYVLRYTLCSESYCITLRYIERHLYKYHKDILILYQHTELTTYT